MKKPHVTTKAPLGLALFQPLFCKLLSGARKSATVALFQGPSEGEWGLLGTICFHAAIAPSAEKFRKRSQFVAGALFLLVVVQIHSPRPFFSASVLVEESRSRCA